MSPEWSPSVRPELPLDVEEELSLDPVEFLLQPSSTPDNPTGARVLEVAQVVGDEIVDVRTFGRDGAVRLADQPRGVPGAPRAADAPFSVPREVLSADEVVIFRAEGPGWVASFHERWGGFVVRGEQRIPLRELAMNGIGRRTPGGVWEVPLGAQERIVLDLGHTRFVAREVVRARRMVARLRDEIDHGAAAIAVFVALTAVLIGTAMGFVPPPPTISANDPQDHVVDIDLLRLLPPPAPVVVQHPSEQPAAAAPRAAGAEGRRGGGNPRGTTPKPAGLIDALDHDPTLQAIAQGTLDGRIARGITGLIGSSGASNGPGLGWRDNGGGGGGTARDADGLALRGDPRAARDLAFGTGRPDGKPGGALPRSDEAITIGHYDRSLVDEVIKRHLSEIRYCYQRELPRTPSLSGKVTVKFTIAGDGSVSTALTKSSTLGSPAVESCINSRFLRMNFPAPVGAGVVIVSYPFMFTTQ